MDSVQYIDDEITEPNTAKANTTDYASIGTLKPMKLTHSDVFRPMIKMPQPVNRERSFTIRKPPPKLDQPIEKIVFACLEDYLQYKELYGS